MSWVTHVSWPILMWDMACSHVRHNAFTSETRLIGVSDIAHSREWALYLWMCYGSHVNRLCLTWEWVISHTWMSYVWHVNELCLLVNVCVMSHMWTGHVSHENQSCLTRECIIFQSANESRLTREWVLSHMWMSHVSHVNVSCRNRHCVMSHMWTSHVSHVNESCLTSECVMSHLKCEQARCHRRISHVSHVNESCLNHKCIMSHTWISYVSHVKMSHMGYIYICTCI